MFDPTLEIGDSALNYVIETLDFDSVLDVGCGYGRHSKKFLEAGKIVTSIDIIKDYKKAIVGNYLNTSLPKCDLVWASHILEHQLNVNVFLSKCRRETNDSGYIAIVVPPLKHQIVGGHVTLWNAGLVMYNLVLAGYDCRKAIVKEYGYNILVVAQAGHFKLPSLNYDRGDIELIQEYLPEGYNYQGFNGDIKELNL